ncbi:MAG TPA: hypothetical protein VGD65_04970 [Chryseosolibacter sp.]
MRTSYGATTILLLCITLFFSNCGGGENEKNAEIERVINLMSSGEWQVHKVDVSGFDLTPAYTNMTISFDKNGNNSLTYTSTDGAPVWKTGIITFQDPTIFLTEGADFFSGRVLNVSETELQISVEWTQQTVGLGRSKSLIGTIAFEFTR